MRTMTGVVSLADPLKDGAVSFAGDGGAFKVTVGDVVSTAKVTDLLAPGGLPSELSCVATAVYWPLASAGLASPDAKAPPVPVAVGVAAAAPLGLAPAQVLARAWGVAGSGAGRGGGGG